MAIVEVECTNCEDGWVESGMLCGTARCSCDGFSGGCSSKEPCDECASGYIEREETVDEVLARAKAIAEKVRGVDKNVPGAGRFGRPEKVLDVFGTRDTAVALLELSAALVELDEMVVDGDVPSEWVNNEPVVTGSITDAQDAAILEAMGLG